MLPTELEVRGHKKSGPRRSERAHSAQFLVRIPNLPAKAGIEGVRSREHAHFWGIGARARYE
eukprot:4367576-Alexandrium_andersonii.AAC.1